MYEDEFDEGQLEEWEGEGGSWEDETELDDDWYPEDDIDDWENFEQLSIWR